MSGIDICLKNNKPYGRPKKELPPEFTQYYQDWKEGNRTVAEICKKFDMSRPTFYKIDKIRA